MRLLTLILVLFLTSCADTISGEKVRKAFKYCEEQDAEVIVVHYIATNVNGYKNHIMCSNGESIHY